MTSVLKGKDILHAKDLKLEHIGLILDTAARFETVVKSGGEVDQHGRKSSGDPVL